MAKSIEALNFIFPWRNYQKELLKNFDSHMADHHFHVIAPPGSGKTILGLEIVKRLGHKTLVLTPTLTIRNQWKERLQTFFSADAEFEAFSFDIKSPSDITFSTYQSLHAFYKSFSDKTDYYAFFKKHSIKTLVLDEAHHLKNAWWTCLMDLKENNPFYVVSLTATPPYDSSRAEVSKYFDLSGEVDDEITVPDLVKENDLSPHQDFVYFTKPNDIEINKIVDFRRNIANFKDQLIASTDFINLLENHRFYKNPNWHLDDLYANTSYFSSILIALNACGIYIDDEKLNILGFEKKEKIKFPKLELNWLEILLQNLLVTDRELLFEHETYLNKLEKQLRILNVFDRKKVDFVGDNHIYKSLSNSPNKLKGIVSIIKTERNQLKKQLRCVVLADFIRKEFISTEQKALSTIDKIGVIPIFKHLKYEAKLSEDLAVLTGSIVIIHKSILDDLLALEDRNNLSISTLEIESYFIEITPNTVAKKSIVTNITKLFENGTIKILVGTKALLGEGWDAPSINSLVLATKVGSFVSSNQMRGRAIRIDANSPNKTGNIWHLSSIDPTLSKGGKDVDILKRRFDAFVGITNTTIKTISNGFDRLDLPEHISTDNIDILNQTSLEHAKNRAEITKKWQNSIGSGTKLTKQIKLLHLGEIPYKKQQRVYALDTLRFVILELVFGIMFFYIDFFLNSMSILFGKGILYFVKALFTGLFIAFGYKLYQTAKLYLRHGFLYKKIKKIGFAIVDTLDDLNMLTTKKEDIKITSEVLKNGEIICSIYGVNNLENSIFTTALREIIEPIDSPRYLLLRTNKLRKEFDVENFHAVPDIFGDKKKKAIFFQKNWHRYLGQTNLVYTRQFDGRKLLLKARLFHAYNALKQTTKETMIWR